MCIQDDESTFIHNDSARSSRCQGRERICRTGAILTLRTGDVERSRQRRPSRAEALISLVGVWLLLARESRPDVCSTVGRQVITAQSEGANKDERCRQVTRTSTKAA